MYHEPVPPQCFTPGLPLGNAGQENSFINWISSKVCDWLW